MAGASERQPGNKATKREREDAGCSLSSGEPGPQPAVGLRTHCWPGTSRGTDQRSNLCNAQSHTNTHTHTHTRTHTRMHAHHEQALTRLEAPHIHTQSPTQQRLMEDLPCARQCVDSWAGFESPLHLEEVGNRRRACLSCHCYLEICSWY